MRTEVFKRTDEDWYPCYKLDSGRESLVEVIFTQTGPNPPLVGQWRVCVWGNDDHGMERDFDDETLAWSVFLQVIGWPVVRHQPLRDLGFVPA